jgi:hypothetical protein
MFAQSIDSKTRENLEILGKSHIFKDFYLAGGSALALHLGHRVSEDLDFFSNKRFDLFQIITEISSLGSLTTDIQTTKTFIGKFNSTKLSAFYYEIPLVKTPSFYGEVSIADPVDIGCMKLDAISGRGLKKDFVDLYFICMFAISFKDLLAVFKNKMRDKNYNFVHLAKSLVYFDDAVDDVTMIKDYDWEKIQKYFLEKSSLVF